ncbi:MAG TPA: hypothetical protein VIK14_15830, partial [Ignavibacteria bacterium]
MGYYLGLVFDPSKEVFDKKKLLKDFCNLGFSMGEEKIDLRYINPELNMCFLLFINKNQELIEKGDWVSVRFSWGEKPDVFQKAIKILFDISKIM